MRNSGQGTVLVTGGAGFLGSHLCDRLVERGQRVVCLDNLATGRTENVRHLLDHPRFSLFLADVTDTWEIDEPLTAVFHLASAASPPDYQRLPVETLEAGSLGTRNALRCAKEHGARLVLVSTSEVYGDPREHPQRETYWGNVNPVGPRSVYDEAKRYAEALVMAHHRERLVDVGIARVFNTYGPRMRPDDGRMIPNFITQALSGRPLTVTGNGQQTRSVCYVADTVEGLLMLGDNEAPGPINIGSQEEVCVLTLARFVRDFSGSRSEIEFIERPEDDPHYRKPDITKARAELGWSPHVRLEEGMRRTLAFFMERQTALTTGPGDDRPNPSRKETQDGVAHRAAQGLGRGDHA